MESSEVIVVGAGVSGLVMARELCKAGMQVILLEARERIGGRIHTLSEEEFPTLAETGAEFIHGRLPQTIKLLKQYGIKFSRVKGEVWQLRNGELKKDYNFISDHHRLLSKKLRQLKEDIPVKKFLELNFPGEEFRSLCNSVTKFVEGYDTADVSRASTFEFREELFDAEDWKQYRVDGGYGRLIHALEEDCKKQGCIFHLSAEVKKIRWKKNEVELSCENGEKFSAKKIVITVPLGILQSGSLKFSPRLSDKAQVAGQLGFGEVIKILLLFDEAFWKKKETQQRTEKNLKKLFFMFSDALIPTWWTQYPSEQPLLTGWISGSLAEKYRKLSEEKILNDAMDSLAQIFGEEQKELKARLRSWKIINWSHEIFTRGSYVYATVHAEQKIEQLGKPVEDTLFFAGEIFAPESGIGLVEAAVASGLKTAKMITGMQSK
jgi:monoamine oxidase